MLVRKRKLQPEEDNRISLRVLKAVELPYLISTTCSVCHAKVKIEVASTISSFSSAIKNRVNAALKKSNGS